MAHRRAPAHAATAEATDWRQIVQLYDQLLAVAPTPVVRMNRAIAVAEVDGPLAALATLAGLAADLAGYHLFHAARADLLERLGRDAEAAAAVDRALASATNAAEVALLEDRRRRLAGRTRERERERAGTQPPGTQRT